jgi:GH43 family beta-xylosidase
MRNMIAKNLAIILLFALNCVILSTSACNKIQTAAQPKVENDTLRTFTNPLGGITNIGDPYILKYNKQYFMYCTSSPDGFKVWQSDNMIDWTAKGLALDRNNPANNWGTGNFWAPEVKYINGRFYMTYSAKMTNGLMKVRIAGSDSPLGPFTNWSEPFIVNDNFSYIDADLLPDGDRVFMFFTKDCSVNIVDGKHTSQIFVAELSKDLKTFITVPIMATTPDQAWESPNNDFRWNEGSYAMKHDNTYYLMYSANVYSSPDYSIGYATATNPFGPWTKYAGNPVLKKDMSIGASGPGHNCVTTSPDDKEMFIVYHTHTYADKPSGNRNLCIDRMTFENGVIKVQGPTRTAQPLPSGILYRVIAK